MKRALAVVIAAIAVAGFVRQAGTVPVAPESITGTIVDEAGSPLSGALVELLRAGRVVYSTRTGADGAFRFDAVARATYVVRATLPGFFAAQRLTVTVSDKPNAALRVVMHRTELKSWQVAAPAPPPPAANYPLSTPAEAPMARRADGARLAPFNTEAYDHIQDNRFHRVTVDPVSTFSIDVDTASYANVRRFLTEGRLPPIDAVRSEELINYFRYAYSEPRGDEPFAVSTELAECPWNPRNRLALIGLQAKQIRTENTPAKNLVFLLDVSGSMTPPNKLPLVKTAMKMLVDTLRSDDRVAIVVYAGESGLALASTPGNRKAAIRAAIDELHAGGSTNGASGIRLAYDTAAEHFIKGGVNRVILATDGDFNVGVTSQGELVRLIEEERERGIFLSVIGVGTGNVKDSTMEKLADKGNGNYSYFDSLHEARRVLIAEAGATLVTVAKDVKIQVEFNPAKVGAYRLIGYENRLLERQDFNDDRKDAGEIGAGHTITALYELVPPGEVKNLPDADPLKYQSEPRPTAADSRDEAMTVKLRYKAPTQARSQLITVAVKDHTAAMSPNLGFAAAVAEFAMLLRRSEFGGNASWDSAKALAMQYRGEDRDGYRSEFMRLIDLAADLDRRRTDGSGSR
jgi:Ca-activated chloride channel family protein